MARELWVEEGAIVDSDGNRLNASALHDNGTYVPILTPVESLTYNADGTIATQTIGGVATSYTYNADGSVATETRSGTTRTYSYNADGTLASVA